MYLACRKDAKMLLVDLEGRNDTQNNFLMKQSCAKIREDPAQCLKHKQCIFINRQHFDSSFLSVNKMF